MSAAPAFPPPWIVKSVWEHASVGLEDGSVAATHEALADEIARRTRTERIEHLFVEGYVEGREFNLALLGGTSDGEPQSLPPAEIQFLGYPVGKPKMVGYRAKWDEGSFEYGNTPRRFDFPGEDERLLQTLISMSRKCWKAFELRGYARVDFRVDGSGRPWVLEINTNPCISPDAGFMAAAGRAGLSMEDVVRRIVAEATHKSGRKPRPNVDRPVVRRTRHEHHQDRVSQRRHGERPRGGPAGHRVHGFFLPRGGGHRGRARRGPAGQGSSLRVPLPVRGAGRSDGRLHELRADRLHEGELRPVLDRGVGGLRGNGLGTQLLEQTEEAIASYGGTRVYIETSARALYAPTRAFYLARGYSQIAELEDFYAPGDAKAMYLKILRSPAR